MYPPQHVVGFHSLVNVAKIYEYSFNYKIITFQYLYLKMFSNSLRVGLNVERCSEFLIAPL